jgi:hypothetical protein
LRDGGLLFGCITADIHSFRALLLLLLVLLLCL